jgi:hypothetical protein
MKWLHAQLFQDGLAVLQAVFQRDETHLIADSSARCAAAFHARGKDVAEGRFVGPLFNWIAQVLLNTSNAGYTIVSAVQAC